MKAVRLYVVYLCEQTSQLLEAFEQFESLEMVVCAVVSVNLNLNDILQLEQEQGVLLTVFLVYLILKG